MKTRIDKPVFYKDSGKESDIFRLAYGLNLPVLLKGPTGCGKSRFVEKMAQELGRPLIEVACHEETSAVDLVGRYILKGGDTVWQDGPLPRALREGAILYLDEVAEAREDVIVVCTLCQTIAAVCSSNVPEKKLKHRLSLCWL